MTIRITPADIKMNSAVKEKWLAALRSGRYKQGRGALAQHDDDGDMLFCCLGVLCDLYAEEHGVAEAWGEAGDLRCDEFPHGPILEFRAVADEFDSGRRGMFATGMPPSRVIEWAGMNSMNAVACDVDYYPYGDRPLFLPSLNDEHRWTFEQIADVIEEAL